MPPKKFLGLRIGKDDWEPPKIKKHSPKGYYRGKYDLWWFIPLMLLGLLIGLS